MIVTLKLYPVDAFEKFSLKYKKKFKKFRENLSKNTHNIATD